MISWKRHLKEINKIILPIFFVVIVIAGCQEKTKEIDYVARVNDSYLSGSDFLEISGSPNINDSSKAEVIRNWITKELLYQEAIKEGIVDDEEFKIIIKKSKKELAGSLLLKSISLNSELSYETNEVEDFFNLYKSEFSFASNSFKLNIGTFNKQVSAVQFRSLILSNGWDKAVNKYSKDKNTVRISSKVILSEQNIYPQKLSRVVSGLYPLEISIVISDDAGYHSVAQVLNKFSKGSVPPFEDIKDIVEKRFLAFKKKQLIDKYIDELYSNNEIEIKN